jgi:exo-beta-1,3-glucanase (GH17 family)
MGTRDPVEFRWFRRKEVFTMRNYMITLLLLAGLLLGFNVSAAKPKMANAPRLWGIDYGAFRDGQSPWGDYPSEADIAEDMKILRDFTTRVRTYSLDGTQQIICRLARAAGMMCYAGADIGSDPDRNDEEIARLLQVACSDHPAALVVGNEARTPAPPVLPLAELMRVIRIVKNNECVKRWRIPVGYSDAYTIFLADDPNIDALVAEVDFVMINIHPYWENIPLEDAPEYVVAKWRAVMEKYPDTQIIIGETGWPSEGAIRDPAVPGEANQQEFLKNFVKIAMRENVPYFFFEAFDEKWKWNGNPETEAEAHWGLWYSDRAMKPRRFLDAPPPLCDILRSARCKAGPARLQKISGRVYGINPREVGSYRVVIYAWTDQWYVQPFVNQPLTSIGSNLTWSNKTHLGNLYACLIVREGYVPPPVLSELPEPDGDVVAISVKECSGASRGK